MYFTVWETQDFTIKEKFRMLRDKLRWWNNEMFRWIDMKIETSVNDLNHTDRILENIDRDDTTEVLGKKKDSLNSFWSNMHLKEILLRHKYRET